MFQFSPTNTLSIYISTYVCPERHHECLTMICLNFESSCVLHHPHLRMGPKMGILLSKRPQQVLLFHVMSLATSRSYVLLAARQSFFFPPSVDDYSHITRISSSLFLHQFALLLLLGSWSKCQWTDSVQAPSVAASGYGCRRSIVSRESAVCCSTNRQLDGGNGQWSQV